MSARGGFREFVIQRGLGVGGQGPPFEQNFIFIRNFGKFGTLFLIFFFNKSVLLPVKVCLFGWVSSKQ